MYIDYKRKCKNVAIYGGTKIYCTNFSCYMYIKTLIVSYEAKKKQHARVYSGLCDHYSELFTWMAALKFENAVTQPP